MTVEAYKKAAAFIRNKVAGDLPKTALTLGSGLNALADELTDTTVIDYTDIPGFPEPTVSGHSGKMLIGKLAGVPIICLQGRAHYYEGHSRDKVIFAVRTLWALGVKKLILTNAAGSLNQAAGPGALMAITDHINFSGFNPLIGPNEDEIGPRFPDMTLAWDKELTDQLLATARDEDITLHQGVYLMASGPNFETPAEIRAFRTLGADAVGMSTVPECLAARHAGMRVCGVSSITNYAAGMTGDELTHHETMEYGAIAGQTLGALLKAFVQRLA